MRLTNFEFQTGSLHSLTKGMNPSIPTPSNGLITGSTESYSLGNTTFAMAALHGDLLRP